MLLELGNLRQVWKIDGTESKDFYVEDYSFHFYYNHDKFAAYVLFQIAKGLDTINLRVYHNNRLEFSNVNTQYQMRNCQWFSDVAQKVLAYLDKEKKAQEIVL